MIATLNLVAATGNNNKCRESEIHFCARTSLALSVGCKNYLKFSSYGFDSILLEKVEWKANFLM